MTEWTTPDSRNTPSTTNLEEEEIVNAPGNDGNASMPERFKRRNPWRKMMMMITHIYLGFYQHGCFSLLKKSDVLIRITINIITEGIDKCEDLNTVIVSVGSLDYWPTHILH